MEAGKSFSYLGSKLLLARQIVSYMPPHKVYIEPFGGSGAVLLNKKPAPMEIFNDLDKNIYNFFKVCRDPVKFRLLMRMLYYTPYCQSTFAEALEKLANKSWKDDVEWAWAWKVVAEMSYNPNAHIRGSYKNWMVGYTRRQSHPQSWQRDIARLYFVHKRLLKVQIACRDGLEVIDKAISNGEDKDILFYIDPPYIRSIRGSNLHYLHEADTIEYHQQLVELLSSQMSDDKFMCLFSCYWHPVYEPLLRAGWQQVDFASYVGRYASRTNKRIETLLLNPRVAAYGATPDLFQFF